MDYNLFLPNAPVIDKDAFSIHTTTKLVNFSSDVLKGISEKRQEILSFFGIDDFRKVQINLYDDKDDFVKFTKQFFEPQSYAIGNFAMGMANFYVSEDDLSDDKKYQYRIRSIIHEFVHLVYKEQVQEKGENNRIVWLDEGLATFLSGQKSSLENIDDLKNWFLRNIVRRDKIIPSIEFLKEHGDKYGKFCDKETQKYNGYDLSYLIVRYLAETLPKEQLQTIIRRKDLIEELGTSVLTNAVKHYSEIFSVKTTFDEISNATELLDYMNQNILYGWLDEDGIQHIDNMKDFRKLYRTSSVEDTINLKLGTCIEQTRLEKEFFQKLDIPCKMFALRSYGLEEQTDDEVKMHCFLLFEYNGKCYHFEHSNPLIPGIHEYENEEMALDNIMQYYQNRDKGKSRRLDEFYDVPKGLSFKEFNEYLNQYDKTK